MACANLFRYSKRCLIVSLLILAAILLVILCFVFLLGSKKPIVTVEQGDLEGTVEGIDNNGSYYSFKGIPYAQAPVGELRFKAPQPPLKWSGKRDASKHGDFCIQYDSRTGEIRKGSEDCLYLNVYTKNLKPTEPQPVLFWIHGGSFFMGSGDIIHYDPRFLLDVDDIVVVTINYRLEVLGFLNLDFAEVPGNVGLKDQLAALQWVNRNIEKFGGDKNNITLIGCSAGSGSVALHILSPQSQGLFHKAIAMSGTALNQWCVQDHVEQRSWQLLQSLGYQGSDPHEALKFLQSVPVEKLVHILLPPIPGVTDETLQFSPVVEKDFGDGNAFLTKKPEVIIEEKSFNAVPLLIGSASAEGIEIAQNEYYVNIAKTQPSFFTPRSLKLNPNVSDDEIGKMIKTFYFGQEEFTDDGFQNFIYAAGDIFFTYDIQRFARKMSSFAPVYYYDFQYENNRNMYKIWYNMTKYKGVCHADDLFYLFDSSLDPSIPNPTQEVMEFIMSYVKLWTNFVKTGNPTPSTEESQLEWKRFTEVEKNYLIIDHPMTSSVNPQHERMEFWDDLYRRYGNTNS